MGRAPCCDKANVKRGPWSPEEDAALRSYIQKHGTVGNWIALPHKAGLKRCGKSCRLRWLNYLRPDIKHGGFTEEEDNIICTIYSKLGSRWSIIASYLPGRTDNDVKNYWNTKLKKKLIANQTNLSATVTTGITDHIHHSPSQTQPPLLLPPLLPPPAGILATVKSEGNSSSAPLIAPELNSVLMHDCNKLYSELQPFAMLGPTQQPSSGCGINNGNLGKASATLSPIAAGNCSSNGYLEYSASALTSDDVFLMELGFAGEPGEGLMFGYGCQEKLGEVSPFCFSGPDSTKAASETKPQGLIQSFTYYS